MSVDASPRPRSAATPSRVVRVATVFLSAIALILGLAPVASAQSGERRIGDFTFYASVNGGQSDLRPGGHVRLDLTATNTHGTGFWLASNRVLNTYGFTVPSGYTLRGSGGDHMANAGSHGQANYFGGNPSNVAMRTVQKDSSRSGWLSFNIPENALGGSVHRFGVRAHLETNGDWFPTANDVVRFTLPAVGTSTQPISVTPSTGRVGENVTLSTRVTASHGSNTPTGTVRFNVDGQTLTANVVNGVATTTTSFATTGSKSVTATYLPSNTSQWNGSSRSGTVRIQSEATQTDLALDPVEVLAGGVVRASANVSPAGAEGDIEFTLGDTTTTVPVAADGTASAELNAGSETGEATVTATFVPANPERYTQSSDSQTVDVFEQTTTSTEVTVDADPARIGEETTLTATVSPSGAAGTAEFTIGDQTYPVTVTDGIATLEHTFATVGEHVVVVDFTPTNTDRYTASTGEVTVNVEAETTQTDLTLDPVEVTAGGDVTATAQVTPADADGEVRFDYGELTQTVPVVDGQAAATFAPESAGTGTITATFLPADPGRYTESSDTQTVEINAEATQTDLTLDPTDVIEGDTIRASAAVTPAGAQGEVEFTAGDTTVTVPVGTDGVAATDLVASAPGEMTVTATFIPADDGRYAGSSDSQTVTVLEQIATSTSLAVDTDPARAGEEATLTATVGPADADGTVTFTVDGQEYPVAVTDGVATLGHTFAATGDYPVTAEFTPADTDRYVASSDELTVSVEAEATQTVLTLDPVEVVAGGTIAATATVTPAGADGVVLFQFAGDMSQTIDVVDGVATATLPVQSAGTDTITATFYPANTERYTQSSDTQTVEVTAEATQTDLTLDPIEVVAGGTIVATAAVTPADAEGQVQFTAAGQTSTVDLADGTATAEFTLDAAGEVTVTAEFVPADPGRYSGSSDTETVNVEAEATQTAVTVDADPARVGEETTLTATVTPADADGAVTFTVDGEDFTAEVLDGVATLAHTFTDAGAYPVTAEFTPANADRYSASTGQVTVNVEVETTTTDLTLAPIEVTAGGTIIATAAVTPADADGRVRFTAAGQTSTVDLADGTATAEFTLDAAGEVTVTAEFIPTDAQRYSGSSDTETVNVEAEQTRTTLAVDPGRVDVGDTVTATAAVTPAGIEGEVEFTAGGATVTVPVDVDGTATAELPTTAAGELTVTATFTPADTGRYSSSGDIRTVEVEGEVVAEPTSVDVDAGAAEPGEEVTITATVSPADAEGQVRFTIDGEDHLVPVVDGVATLVHVAGERGNYTVRAEFVPADPEAYAPSEGTETLVVGDDSSGTDPDDGPDTGSLSLIGLISSIGIGLHSSGSLGSLGSSGPLGGSGSLAPLGS